jgi:ABC-type sugar transport system ATPase subunit
VILERPLRDVVIGTTDGISALVDSARERGAAILWIAREGDAWHDVARRPSSCWRLGDGRLVAMEMK